MTPLNEGLASKTAQPSQPTSGSDSNQSEPEFLAIGQIVKPHGIKGEVSVKVLTDFTERFNTMKTVYLGNELSATLYNIKTTRWNKERVLIFFDGVSDRNEAESLRGLYLKIPIEQAMPLDSDTHYHYQLQGLQVITDTNEYLGILTEILETGANDVYVVQGPHGEVLLPAIKEVILAINLATKKMQVHLLPGLI